MDTQLANASSLQDCANRAWFGLGARGESLYELPVGPESGINNRRYTGGKEGPETLRQLQLNRQGRSDKPSLHGVFDLCKGNEVGTRCSAAAPPGGCDAHGVDERYRLAGPFSPRVSVRNRTQANADCGPVQAERRGTPLLD